MNSSLIFNVKMLVILLLLFIHLFINVVVANRYYGNPNNQLLFNDYYVFNETMTSSMANASHQHGLIMCGYKKVLPNILTVITYLRIGMKSKLRLAIAHCDELDDQDMREIRMVDNSIEFVNICSINGPFGHSHHILRGFLCKVAALIMSPFPNTILFDLDVIWLRKPEELFTTNSFNRKGAFYFRDRIITNTFSDKMSIETYYGKYTSIFSKYGVEINGQAALQLSRENGISIFWYLYAQYALQNSTNGVYTVLNEVGESSIVAMDRARHIRMLYVLRSIVLDKTFDSRVFYGDKELFWIAHTIADDEFTWSSFLAGQYGDCYGVLIHFHPDDYDEVDMKKVRPFHINGEYLVEENVLSGAGGLIAVGDYIRHVVSVPKRVISNDMTIGSYNTWKQSTNVFSTGCSYTDNSYYQSMPVRTDLVNVYILLYQWVYLSFRQSRSSPMHDCIPINYHFFDEIVYMFQKFDLFKYCPIVGCPNPHIPFTLNPTLPWSRENERYGYYCEPVYYSNTSNIQEFINATIDARQPFNKYILPFDINKSNGLVVQCVSHHTQWNFCKDFRTIYRIWDKQYHAFPNFESFISMNYSLDQVIPLEDYKFYTLPIGKELPSI